MTLTTAQKKVVQEMRNGAIIHRMGGLYPSAFITHGKIKGIQTVRLATVSRLESEGLIVTADMKYGSGTYTLTELGKSIEL